VKQHLLHPSTLERGPHDLRGPALARGIWHHGLTLQSAGGIENRAEVGNGLTEHEVVDVFTAQTTADLTMDLNPDEVLKARGCARNDLITDRHRDPLAYTPWLRIYFDAGIAT
jgi:isopentenyl-diphosphate delta-isomerase